MLRQRGAGGPDEENASHKDPGGELPRSQGMPSTQYKKYQYKI